MAGSIGKIGSSDLQACVADVLVGSSSCSIRSHFTKEKSLVDNTIYIQTTFAVGKISFHLSPSLLVSSLSPKVLPSLLKAKRSVEVWSSLLPHLILLYPSEIKNLVISVDQVVFVKSDFKTPFKSNASTLPSSSNLPSSVVVDEPLVLSDNTLRVQVKQLDRLLPLVCTRIDSSVLRSEHLCSTFNILESSIVDDLDRFGSRVSLLQDNIGQDPRITDFPLRTPWKGISFLKSSLSDTVRKILPVLQTMTVSLSLH